jgi:hypothetical protein
MDEVGGLGGWWMRFVGVVEDVENVDGEVCEWSVDFCDCY